MLASQPREVSLDTHIDLVALLRQLCEDANFEGRPRGKSARLSSPLDELVMASHGDLLHKAFDNILRNALAHTADNTGIDVSLEASGGQCQVRVRDRGPGVPESELERIFEAFYRVDTARSRDTGGHGLGLSIAYRAIAQHGGDISARNTGQGLEILVALPVQIG